MARLVPPLLLLAALCPGFPLLAAEPAKRYLELPKIDPAQVEHPRDEAGKGGEKAGKNGAKAPMSDREIRAEIERRLATYGSRMAARKKEKTAPPVPSVELQLHGHWAYEGEEGPAGWGKLHPDWALCGNGKRQSPIDIRDGVRVDLEPIAFDYRPSRLRISDTGHTIQAELGEGSSITVMGREYRLVQFHFHRPSEERINGHQYEMVLHLVHRGDNDQLAVVAVMLERGPEHPVIQFLWNHLPLEAGLDNTPEAGVDLVRLLPENRSYFTYMGSLTTPPCTEGVLWMVLKQPVSLSADQIAIFSRLYRNNARPIQAGNNRLIKESR